LFAQDHIYAAPQARITPFAFDDAVVAVFPDMISRSVPGYDMVLPLIGLWAARYAQPESRIYDLGCSLGAATLAMRQRVTQPGVRFVGVDNSLPMVTKCRELVSAEFPTAPINIVHGDVRDIPIHNASVVVMNFTLMFLPPPDRATVLRAIFDGLRPGGILLLSEKITFADPTQDAHFIAVHHDFKRANGYSDLEVSQKRSALENVLVPDTVPVHQTRLRDAGFESAELWFQALNFASLVAHKAA
jgi:tRNA (cmo5U34)-methyltransferase